MTAKSEKALLSAENIEFGYEKDDLVLCDVSVNFFAGQLTGILGPNGSGKTTLIKALSGAIKPLNGNVKLCGRNVEDYPAKELARRMSVVPQATHIDFDMTALDIALMGRQPYLKRFERETPDDIAIAREALRRTDVLKYEDTPVTSLSGGEMQRVIIARALTQQAGVMLLDEPVSSLDIRHTAQILSLTRNLTRESNVCAVCVLHDLSLAGWFCDKIALMSAGKLFAFGAPKAVLTSENIKAVYQVDADIINEGEKVRVLPRYE